MPSQSVAASDQTPDKPKSARTPKVSPRLKAAFDLMVWDNITDNEAAVRCKISIHTIRLALRTPVGRAYFRQQMDVLRERESPRNIHTLVQVRDASGNAMARVAAIKEMKAQSDQQVAAGQTVTPGVVIQIIGNASLMAHERGSDAKTLILHEPVQDER